MTLATPGAALPAQLALPSARRAAGVVVLPGSKSISNRTLLLSAMAEGVTTLVDLLDADDTARMLDALALLGVQVERVDARQVRVHGTAGHLPVASARLFLGNAGTAVRPLTAALAVHGGAYEISGVPRMHERPIRNLVDALRPLGCAIRYLGNEGFPPLAIGAAGGSAGGRVAIRGDVSSQFLSALLMALPLARGSAGAATTIDVIGALISRPYVEITTNLMQRFGVGVATPDLATFVVPAGARYRSPGTLEVEGDASGASYFLAAGVLGGGPVRVTGVGRESIQGDVAFADVLARLGADIRFGPNWIEARAGTPLVGGDIDCLAIPDAAMTLAITALTATAPTTLSNIGSWRVKETDRIAAMSTELRKLGVTVAEGPDWLRVTPPTQMRTAIIGTYDDHRMAMCFALTTLLGIPVVIDDPGCVRKTFPAYFGELARILT